MSLTSTPPAFCRDQMGFATRTRDQLTWFPTLIAKTVRVRKRSDLLPKPILWKGIVGKAKETLRKDVSRWDKAPKAKPGLLMREQMGWPATITK